MPYIRKPKRSLRTSPFKKNKASTPSEASASQCKKKPTGEKKQKKYVKAEKVQADKSFSVDRESASKGKKKTIQKRKEKVQTSKSAGFKSENSETPGKTKQSTKDNRRTRARKSFYKEIPSGGSESDSSESSASSISDGFAPQLDFKDIKEGRPLLCNYCEKPFKSYASFLRHSRIHKDKPFKCVICKFIFKLRSELIYHMKRDHPEVDPYPCEYTGCTKSFHTQKMRNDHVKMHWRFTCKFCKRGFVFRHQMQEHVQENHV